MFSTFFAFDFLLYNHILNNSISFLVFFLAYLEEDPDLEWLDERARNSGDVRRVVCNYMEENPDLNLSAFGESS